MLLSEGSDVRIVASERVMSMLHSVSSIVRIVAFRFDLAVSFEDLAQTDSDCCVLYKELFRW